MIDAHKNKNGRDTSIEKKVDFDIHGLVGIRLINPTETDVAAVTKQIGPLRKPFNREPDIIIRFVDHLPVKGLRHLTYGKDGFTDDGFYILRSSKKSAKVKMPFDQIGKKCEIVCESGLKSVPLLLAILNLTMLTKDVVSLHASGFVYNDTGVLVTGWAKGGKTETLLAFAAHGARYVGDEWILLTGDGEMMYGIPEIIRLWQWHLDFLPHLKKEIKRETRMLFKGINKLDNVQQKMAKGALKKSSPTKWLGEAMPAFKRQLNVRFDPKVIFGEGYGPFHAPYQKVILGLSRRDPELLVERIAPKIIVDRMISSIQYEFLPFWEHYISFKFAFPDLKNEFLDNVRELQYDILHRALSKKESYVFQHPYPVSLHEVYNKLRPIVEAPVRDATAHVG